MKNLFLIYLGGDLRGNNIEIHNLIFIIGNKIENIIENIKSVFDKNISNLHIDSYTKIIEVDGYKIEPLEISIQEYIEYRIKKEQLWLINLGGNIKEELQEQHELINVVACSKREAIKKAKNKSKKKLLNIHIDNIMMIEELINMECNVNSNDKKWILKLKKSNDNKNLDKLEINHYYLKL